MLTQQVLMSELKDHMLTELMKGRANALQSGVSNSSCAGARWRTSLGVSGPHQIFHRVCPPLCSAKKHFVLFMAAFEKDMSGTGWQDICSFKSLSYASPQMIKEKHRYPEQQHSKKKKKKRCKFCTNKKLWCQVGGRKRPLACEFKSPASHANISADVRQV